MPVRSQIATAPSLSPGHQERSGPGHGADARTVPPQRVDETAVGDAPQLDRPAAQDDRRDRSVRARPRAGPRPPGAAPAGGTRRFPHPRCAAIDPLPPTRPDLPRRRCSRPAGARRRAAVGARRSTDRAPRSTRSRSRSRRGSPPDGTRPPPPPARRGSVAPVSPVAGSSRRASGSPKRLTRSRAPSGDHAMSRTFPGVSGSCLATWPVSTRYTMMRSPIATAASSAVAPDRDRRRALLGLCALEDGHLLGRRRREAARHLGGRHPPRAHAALGLRHERETAVGRGGDGEDGIRKLDAAARNAGAIRRPRPARSPPPARRPLPPRRSRAGARSRARPASRRAGAPGGRAHRRPGTVVRSRRAPRPARRAATWDAARPGRPAPGPDAPASATGCRSSSLSQMRTVPSRVAAASTCSSPAIATTPPWCAVSSSTAGRPGPLAAPMRWSRVMTRRPPSRVRSKRTRMPGATSRATSGARARIRVVLAGRTSGMSSCSMVSQGPGCSTASTSPSPLHVVVSRPQPASVQTTSSTRIADEIIVRPALRCRAGSAR